MDREHSMDQELLKDILSSLTGANVKEHSEPRGENSVELTTDNFLSTTLLSALHSIEQNILPGLVVFLTPTDQRNADFTAGRAGAVPPDMHVNLENFHDPDFDYDFENLSGSSLSERGGEPYTRPRGWYRYALKVLGMYPDGDAWLGSEGWRDHSVDGEWPVSYHGTSLRGAEGIVGEHYKTGPHEVYGRGIYSTPNRSEAEYYARLEPFRSSNGKSYIIMLQNRINPDHRKICDREDYWLIEIPAGTSQQEEKKKVEEAIRPYGILVKEVTEESEVTANKRSKCHAI